MRLHRIAPEVWVATSRAWRTTCTVAGMGRQLVIDGPVDPGEVAFLAASATPTDLIATHADWDHLLAPLAFPDARRHAGSATIARARDDAVDLADELDTWDRAHCVAPRVMPDWTCAAPLIPGRSVPTDAGAIELIDAPGHTVDGLAVLLRRAGVLVVGDYLSPVEIPAVDPTAGIGTYLATLSRLEGVLGRASVIVPGHGWPLGSARAGAILAADRAYLEALATSGDAPMPRGGGNPDQRRQHAVNRRTARAD